MHVTIKQPIGSVWYEVSVYYIDFFLYWIIKQPIGRVYYIYVTIKNRG